MTINSTGPISFGGNTPGSSIAYDLGESGKDGTYPTTLGNNCLRRLKSSATGSWVDETYTVNGSVSVSELLGKTNRTNLTITVGNWLTSYTTTQTQVTGSYYAYVYYPAYNTYVLTYYPGTSTSVSATFGEHIWGFLNMPQYTQYTGWLQSAWGAMTGTLSWMNSHAIWYSNATQTGTMTMEMYVYFPYAGAYTFKHGFDNSGTIYIDGTSVASGTNTYTTPTSTSVTVAKGARLLKIVGNNTGGAGGMALQILKSDSTQLYSTRDSSRYMKYNTSYTNVQGTGTGIYGSSPNVIDYHFTQPAATLGSISNASFNGCKIIAFYGLKSFFPTTQYVAGNSSENVTVLRMAIDTNSTSAISSRKGLFSKLSITASSNYFTPHRSDNGSMGSMYASDSTHYSPEGTNWNRWFTSSADNDAFNDNGVHTFYTSDNAWADAEQYASSFAAYGTYYGEEWNSSSTTMSGANRTYYLSFFKY